MSPRNALTTAIGTLLAVTALQAPAATLTLTGWTYGNGNNVSATTPAYNGQGGGFSGTLAGAPGFDGPVRTYCVEISESFSFGTAYPEYTVVAAESYFSAARVQVLSRLVSYVFGNDLFASTAAAYRDDLSTALQLAIWNTVYDSDVSLAAGSFNDAGAYGSNAGSNFADANDLLAASQLPGQAVGYRLYVLRSVGAPGVAGHQDQLIWQAIPEPASLSLAAAALAVAGLARRRRAARR